MQDGDGAWHLFVYDVQKGLWHTEDDTHVIHFARYGGNLYFLNDRGEVWITGNIRNPPEGTTAEGPVEWFAEFGDFAEYSKSYSQYGANKKGVSKIQIRLELDEGASVQVYIQFDTDGEWQRFGGALGEGSKRSYYLPIIPRRGDHYRLKLEGVGPCRVYSMVREFYSGSELKSIAGRQ